MFSFERNRKRDASIEVRHLVANACKHDHFFVVGRRSALEVDANVRGGKSNARVEDVRADHG
jgi:hypothetical protein